MNRRDDPTDEGERHLVRNVALTISGGAILTVVGVALAQGAGATEAGSGSDGDATAAAGGSSAVGNHADTGTSQSVTVSGNLGTIQVIDQQASVHNGGSASAGSGGNVVVGNGSTNGAGTYGGGGTGAAANGSDGSGSVTTGDVDALGNRSNTGIDQTAEGDATGLLGGILVVNQKAEVVNEGDASASSGANGALGNGSDNEAGIGQGGSAGSAIAANDASATNDSDGSARIRTGDADAIGNDSATEVDQSASGTAGGALGGIIVFNQQVAVLNAGSARANTGGNEAGGNGSTNAAAVAQGAGAGDGGPAPEPYLAASATSGAAPVSIASNNGEASNSSDGTARIVTGDAVAVGNRSDTDIAQEHASGQILGSGGVGVLAQGAVVVNEGEAWADTGHNSGAGNLSTNEAAVGQEAYAGEAADVTVAGNFGLAGNESDGTARIRTGDASAIGNDAETSVSQAGAVTGGSVATSDQWALVVNEGSALATTGSNEAAGNASANDAVVEALGTTQGGAADVAVVGQFDLATNDSDGTASIVTGNATAVGSSSETTVEQSTSDPGPSTSQSSTVVNHGGALANTGANTATGNASTSGAEIESVGGVGGLSGVALVELSAPAVAAQDVITSNNGAATNASAGTGRVTTGDASAIGNLALVGVEQTSTASGPTVVIALESEVVNAGVGIANTGLNSATGNASSNSAGVEQATGAETSGGTVAVAANDGAASNSSSGRAVIVTGAAVATGNSSTTTVAQGWTGSLTNQGAVYVVESSSVVNAGLGIANTGLNAAVGNASENGAAVEQVAGSGGATTASADGSATNESSGTARIVTGTATATGNSSITTVVQSVTVTQATAMPIVVHQVSHIVNVGVSAANSGGNLALGNISVNDASVDQELAALIEQAYQQLLATAGLPSVASSGGGTAALTGTATNTSAGTARITTGAATATGNSSTTTVTQGWTGVVAGQGVMYVIQQSVVVNLGVALANTGGNVAIGNASQNTAGVLQVTTGWTAPGSVTSMVAAAINRSDGLARITTGVATATGNSSTTTVIQIVEVLGNGVATPYVLVQQSFVHNIGIAVANTGGNIAIGNGSTNDAEVVQIGPGDGTEVLSGTATNESTGTAIIDTGVTPTPPNPPVTPTPPTVIPETPEVPDDAVVEGATLDEPAAAVEVAGTLPYTGSDRSRDAAALGLLLLLAGAGLDQHSRRRRRTAS